MNVAAFYLTLLVTISLVSLTATHANPSALTTYSYTSCYSYTLTTGTLSLLVHSRLRCNLCYSAPPAPPWTKMDPIDLAAPSVRVAVA